jgi:hypothetical protein
MKILHKYLIYFTHYENDDATSKENCNRISYVHENYIPL